VFDTVHALAFAVVTDLNRGIVFVLEKDLCSPNRPSREKDVEYVCAPHFAWDRDLPTGSDREPAIDRIGV